MLQPLVAMPISPSVHCAAESPDTGTALMSKIAVSNGDVIGVAVQQSDLPMIQLLIDFGASYIHRYTCPKWKACPYSLSLEMLI
jgi:hypothetical protein